MADPVHPDRAPEATADATAATDSRRVFISYSSRDSSIAGDLCGALERDGFGCWIAPRDVAPGAFYAESIVRAIDGASVVLLVLSRHAAASPHVVREVERATSKRRVILAFRVDGEPIPPALEYFLNASHWLDASSTAPSDSLPRAVEAVRRLVGPAATPFAAPGARRPELSGPAPASAAPQARARSIAVLPFANMSTEPDQEYFSDGLAEEIINLLAHVPGLKVIARTSAFAFRGKEQDVRGIADALGVTHLLEGSVRRSGSRLRVTGQLIDAADGAHVWSERFDREMSDVFAIQDEISTAIVGALRVQLVDEAGTRRSAPNLAAYEAYLRARHHATGVTPESLESARQCFGQAIQLDANFPLAHLGSGYLWINAMIFGRCPAHRAVPAARAAAREALRLDVSLPEAHAMLGLLAAMYDFDWATAERHFEFPRAKEVGFATIRPMYGWYQFLRGNAERAVDLAWRAIDEDPLDVWPRMNLQAFLQAAGRPADALEQLNHVLAIDGEQVVAMVAMALIHAQQGDLVQALEIARRAHSVAPWYLDAVAVLAALLRRTGDVEASLPLFQSLDAARGDGDAPAHALYHLVLGNLEQGADWAERAIAERDLLISIYLRFVVSTDLRASPRWPRIAGLLNLQH